MNKKRISEIYDTYKTKKVAVVGDMMLDVYVWGKASRISQEAPVPIVGVKNKTQCLGGAANVMRNIVTLGAKASAFGVIGDDESGKSLTDLLNKYSIETSSLYVEKDRVTTEKQRVVASQQQLLRIDYEDVYPITVPIKDKIISDLLRIIKNKEIDAVIFEDYAKGMLDPELVSAVAGVARESEVMVMLDPHPGHPLNTTGLTLMTPNRSEAFGLTGIYCTDPVSPVEKDESLAEVAKKILADWQPDHLLITLGSQGMALFGKDGSFYSIPTKAREVFDVSGAGDTVISAFTLALLGGATIIEAADFANHAAGVVVGKVGTVSVELEEVIANFEKEKA